VQARRAYALLLFFSYIFSDFRQTNYLDIYQTDLRKIYRIGRTLAVDEDLKLFFSILQGTLPWQPILWANSTSNIHLVVRPSIARAATPAYDKKRNCYAGAQANKLYDSMDTGETIK